MKKLLSLLLSFALLCTLLAGCGDKDESGGAQGSQPSGATKIEKNLSPKEALAQSLVGMLNELRAMSGSFGIDVSKAFGLPEDVLSYPVCDMKLAVTDEDDGMVYTFGQLSQKNGADAMQQLSISTDANRSEGAVYFKGDTMLVRSVDLSKPLIQFPINGAPLSYMQPMDRYQACLIRDNPGETYGAWENAMSSLSTAVSNDSSEVDTSSRTLSAGSLNADGKSYTIHAKGEAAAAIFSNLSSALMNDFHVCRLMGAADNVAQPDDEQLCRYTFSDVGMEGASKDSLDMTLEVCTVDNIPSALFLNVASDGGTIQIELTSLRDGKNVAQRLFTKYTYAPLENGKTGGYTALVENSTSGDTQDSSQIICMPDGTERMRYQLHVVTSGSDKNRTSDYTFHYTMDGSGYDSTGTYSHATSGSVIDGSFSGELVNITAKDGAGETTPFSGTIMADKAERPIEFPEVVEGSAITAANRAELSFAMSGKECAEPFNGIDRMSPLQQLIRAYLFLMQAS